MRLKLFVKSINCVYMFYYFFLWRISTIPEKTEVLKNLFYQCKSKSGIQIRINQPTKGENYFPMRRCGTVPFNAAFNTFHSLPCGEV